MIENTFKVIAVSLILLTLVLLATTCSDPVPEPKMTKKLLCEKMTSAYRKNINSDFSNKIMAAENLFEQLKELKCPMFEDAHGHE